MSAHGGHGPVSEPPPGLSGTRCYPEIQVGRSGARPRGLLLSPPCTRARADLSYLSKGVGELWSPCPPHKLLSSPSEPHRAAPDGADPGAGAWESLASSCP